MEGTDFLKWVGAWLATAKAKKKMAGKTRVAKKATAKKTAAKKTAPKRRTATAKVAPKKKAAAPKRPTWDEDQLLNRRILIKGRQIQCTTYPSLRHVRSGTARKLRRDQAQDY